MTDALIGNDLGSIETARGPEHYLLLPMALMKALGTTGYGIAVQDGSVELPADSDRHPRLG